jgi:hypothetical protein
MLDKIVVHSDIYLLVADDWSLMPGSCTFVPRCGAPQVAEMRASL